MRYGQFLIQKHKTFATLDIPEELGSSFSLN